MLYRRNEDDDTFVTAVVTGIQEGGLDVTIPIKDVVPFAELGQADVPAPAPASAEAPAPAPAVVPTAAEAPPASKISELPPPLDEATLEEGSKVCDGDRVGFIARVHGDGAIRCVRFGRVKPL